MPEIITTKADVRRRVAAVRAEGKSVGFVPTMGALHAGHRALLERCVAENGFTVLSVFVNPTQFGPAEDYDRYPRQLEADAGLAGEVGADVVFAPAADEMYADDHSTWVEEEKLSEGLCGARRPGHFRGVTTVCTKLLNIVTPDRVYLGKKDYQQWKIVQRMARDLDMPVEVLGVETVREEDGLAISSRNQYLDTDARQAALAIPRALGNAEALIGGGERSTRAVADAVRTELVRHEQIKLDYIEVVDAETLEPAVPLAGRVCIAVAAYVGDARLIDNIVVDCDVPDGNN